MQTPASPVPSAGAARVPGDAGGPEGGPAAGGSLERPVRTIDAAVLAGRVKTLRQIRGLTVRELAARSEVSVGVISNLENAKANTSIAILCQVCNGLGVEVADLMAAGAMSGETVRPGEREVLEIEGGIRKTVLLRDARFGVSQYEVFMPPGAATGTVNRHAGALELIYVVHNALTVYLDDIRFDLERGDTLDFRSELNHYIRNESDGDTVFHWLVAKKGK